MWVPRLINRRTVLKSMLAMMLAPKILPAPLVPCSIDANGVCTWWWSQAEQCWECDIFWVTQEERDRRHDAMSTRYPEKPRLGHETIASLLEMRYHEKKWTKSL